MKRLLLCFILIFSLLAYAQVTKERKVYYLDCTYTMKKPHGIWDVVRSNLKKAINNVNDETTELKELQDELSGFIEGLPRFICREEIYDHSSGLDDKKEREDYLTKAKEQYCKLIAYAKGNEFFDYVIIPLISLQNFAFSNSCH